jgi:hypothetical protein
MWQKILSVLGLVVVLVAMAIGGTFGKLIGKSAFGPSKPTPQQMEQALSEGLQKGAQQINARGPTMVDKDTRMDSASAGPGARMTYHYTFPNYTSRDIDANWLRTNLLPTVRKGVCENKDMAPSLRYGATYAYSYSGGDGIKITEFEVRQSDCGP